MKNSVRRKEEGILGPLTSCFRPIKAGRALPGEDSSRISGKGKRLKVIGSSSVAKGEGQKRMVLGVVLTLSQ